MQTVPEATMQYLVNNYTLLSNHWEKMADLQINMDFATYVPPHVRVPYPLGEMERNSNIIKRRQAVAVARFNRSNASVNLIVGVLTNANNQQYGDLINTIASMHHANHSTTPPATSNLTKAARKAAGWAWRLRIHKEWKRDRLIRMITGYKRSWELANS